MDVTPLVPPDQKVIQSYAGGRFRISGEVFETAVIVGPGFVRVWDGIVSPESLAALSSETDVLLIGSGARAELVMPATRHAFKEKGLHVEVMDTGAACRTFNVLSAEGRRVAAALLPLV